MSTETAARDRIRAILAAPEAATIQRFAQHVAFETEASPEEAVGIFRALLADIADQPPSRVGYDYATRKAEAGTLGLGTPEHRDNPSAVADGWAKAAAEINAARGATH